MASIASETEVQQNQEFFFKVTVELLKHSKDYVFFNKNLLNRQMTRK